jgi:dihydrofolate synthase/folylpolyglutamate synthase
MDRDFTFQSHAPAHRLDYQGLALNMKDVELSLAGPFQHENAAIAIAALEAMRAMGWHIEEDAIRHGLNSVYWPGRFDIVSRRPLVVLDCAHNELSIQALLDTIAVELGPDIKPRLVFGCQETKTWEQMATMLAPRVRDVTLTMAKPKRPLAPENLSPIFSQRQVPNRVERDPMRAIEMVIAESAPQDMVLVTGSVYLIGEIYQYFLAREGRSSLFPENGA